MKLNLITKLITVWVVLSAFSQIIFAEDEKGFVKKSIESQGNFSLLLNIGVITIGLGLTAFYLWKRKNDTE